MEGSNWAVLLLVLVSVSDVMVETCVMGFLNFEFCGQAVYRTYIRTYVVVSLDVQRYGSTAQRFMKRFCSDSF